MALKLRLQRKGKKQAPFYHIVAADSRESRDGKSIEKIGTYNPLTNPATIDVVFDRALDWIQKGAQPTDTVRQILTYTGVMYKNHLLKGVAKGAFTAADADVKFDQWVAGKAKQIDNKKLKLANASTKDEETRLKAEIAKNDARSKAIEAKKAEAEALLRKEEVVEAEAEVVAEVEVAPEVVAEVAPEAPTAEAAPEVTPDAPVAE